MKSDFIIRCSPKCKYYKINPNIRMNKKPAPKASNQGAQSKIVDSNSWVVSMQHYTSQNTIGVHHNKNQGKEIQYAIASTFDGWVSIKSIDVERIKWAKIYEMKMSMPVINSFIQFNEKFEPQSVVLAYFDGSIDYSPWSQIEKNYSIQFQAGKRRSISKSFPQIIRQSSRLAYINNIVDEFQSVEETFMLETICFLYKKGQHVYVINFKGELKILRIKANQRKIQLVSKIDLGNRIIKAENLIGLSQVQKECILVAIAFLDTPIPIILELSPKITQTQIQQKLQFIYRKHLANNYIPTKQISQIKLVTFDPHTKLIITCNEKNKIQIYSFDKQSYTQKDFVFIANIQKKFSINYKDNVEIINDISVKDNKLAIICKHSFTIFDLAQDFMLKYGQKLKQEIQFGRFVAPQSQKAKNLLLLKKKFYYQDPQVRKSTTLHLFTGK